MMKNDEGWTEWKPRASERDPVGVEFRPNIHALPPGMAPGDYVDARLQNGVIMRNQPVTDIWWYRHLVAGTTVVAYRFRDPPKRKRK